MNRFALIVLIILFADIIRLLLMVPIYALISLASYLFWVRSLSPSHLNAF